MASGARLRLAQTGGMSSVNHQVVALEVQRLQDEKLLSAVIEEISMSAAGVQKKKEARPVERAVHPA